MKNPALCHIFNTLFPTIFVAFGFGSQGNVRQILSGVFVAALHKRANFLEEPQEKINSVFNKLSWQRISQLFKINQLLSALEKTFN
jgi:hypothetical protein